ncbi:MAG: hypothetical protein GXP04_08430 [Alphaproteobacteria bacterium]|nr:hypothetical protein [Alphaproteobacteria bacterium]
MPTFAESCDEALHQHMQEFTAWLRENWKSGEGMDKPMGIKDQKAFNSGWDCCLSSFEDAYELFAEK